MLVSKERQDFYIAEIRIVMIKNPGISAQGICNILKDKNLTLDREYIGRLRNKIDKKRAHAININSIKYTLEEIEEIGLKIKKLWEIIDAPSFLDSKAVKVSAMRELREERIRLEEIILHLGGTQKDLGKISIE